LGCWGIAAILGARILAFPIIDADPWPSGHSQLTTADANHVIAAGTPPPRCERLAHGPSSTAWCPTSITASYVIILGHEARWVGLLGPRDQRL